MGGVRYFAMLIFIYLFVCSCTSYIDPKEINVADYVPAVNELAGRLKAADSLSNMRNEEISWLILDSPTFNKALIARFPKSYALVKTKKVREFFISNEGCIFIILKIHERNFGSGIECIKTRRSTRCNLGSSSEKDIEKEVELNNGWEYQLIGSYFE
jgi:hypothetical protein